METRSAQENTIITSFFKAIEDNDFARVKLLFNPRLQTCEIEEDIPLEIASLYEHWQIVEFLLDQLEYTNRYSPQQEDDPIKIHLGFVLLDCVYFEKPHLRTHIIKRLLDLRASLACCYEGEEQFPLHLAAEKGEAQIVLMLLEAGADFNALDNQQQTPLLLALKNGHDTCVKILSDFAMNMPILALLCLMDEDNPFHSLLVEPGLFEHILNELPDNLFVRTFYRLVNMQADNLAKLTLIRTELALSSYKKVLGVDVPPSILEATHSPQSSICFKLLESILIDTKITQAQKQNEIHKTVAQLKRQTGEEKSIALLKKFHLFSWPTANPKRLEEKYILRNTDNLKKPFINSSRSSQQRPR